MIKKRIFHEYVDDIMDDGRERTAIAIIENLKDSMSGKSKDGNPRSGFNVPKQRTLTYYLRVNRQYMYLGKGTRNARWVKQ